MMPTRVLLNRGCLRGEGGAVDSNKVSDGGCGKAATITPTKPGGGLRKRHMKPTSSIKETTAVTTPGMVYWLMYGLPLMTVPAVQPQVMVAKAPAIAVGPQTRLHVRAANIAGGSPHAGTWRQYESQGLQCASLCKHCGPVLHRSDSWEETIRDRKTTCGHPANPSVSVCVAPALFQRPIPPPTPAPYLLPGLPQIFRLTQSTWQRHAVCKAV